MALKNVHLHARVNFHSSLMGQMNTEKMGAILLENANAYVKPVQELMVNVIKKAMQAIISTNMQVRSYLILT